MYYIYELITPVVYLLGLISSKVLGRRDDLWVFANFISDQQFSENSKYLYLYLHDREDIDVQSIWITDTRSVYETLQNEGYTVYFRHSLKAKYLIWRAQYVFLSSGLKAIPWEYSGGAIVTQLTHGIPLKGPRKPTNHPTLGAVDLLQKKITNWIYDVDFYCVSSIECQKQFEEYVEASDRQKGYLERSIPSALPILTGYPKNDVLFDEINGSRLGMGEKDIETLNRILNEKYTFGYFPTFREYNEMSSPLDVEALDLFLEKTDTQLAVKPHRHMDLDVKESENIYKINPDIDIYPFLDNVDCLITDYSSIYFDFILMDKPIVLYTYDYKRYQRNRGLHPRYEEVVVGERATNFDELLFSLQSILQSDEFANEREKIRDRFFKWQDGSSSKRIVKIFR